MNQEELKQRLIELTLTDIECDKDGHGDCSMCEYRFADDKCAKYYSGIMVDYFIAHGVTIRERGEWEKKTLFPIHYDCSVCGLSVDYKKPFCPHCGADMRGDAE